MPIYEYTCKDCEKEFETLVLSSSEKIACEACGSARVDKRFSVFGVGAASAPECGMGASSAAACPPVGCSLPQCSRN